MSAPLTEAFTAARPGTGELPADLEAQLAALLHAGRDAWPELALDDARFVRFVARAEGSARLDALRANAADLYLACACDAGSKRALDAFERLHMANLPIHLRRFGRAPGILDEVAQELRTLLFVGRYDSDGVIRSPPQIRSYAGRGPLASWFRITATRLALDHLRRGRARREVDDGAIVEELALGSDPSLDYLKGQYRNEFRAAVEQAFGTLQPRERVLLRMSVLEHLTHERIGKWYQVTQPTVSRWIKDAVEELARATRRLLAARLGTDTEEVRMIFDLICTKFDLNLKRLLQDTDESAGG